MQEERKLKFWLVVIFIAMLATAAIPFQTASWIHEIQDALENSQDRADRMVRLLSLLKDAETGQRGFVITGREEFLEPYHAALPQINQIKAEVRADTVNGEGEAADNSLFDAIRRKLDELAATISLRREKGFNATEPIISSARGKAYMDQIREIAGGLILDEHRLHVRLRSEFEKKAKIAAYLNLGGVLLNLALLTAVLGLIFRLLRERIETARALRKSSDEMNRGLTELEKRNGEIALMAQMAQALESVVSVKETCSIIAVYGAKLLPFSHGALYLFRNSRDLVEKEAEWGGSQDMPQTLEPQDCWALRQGYPHVAASVNDLCCAHYQIEQGETDRHVCIPLMAQSEVLGLICLDIRAPGEEHGLDDAQREENLARAVSEQIALGLSNARLREVLRQQSIIDPLTGLFNRRYMDETLKRELSRAVRNSAPLSLIMLDIDHFKKVNDTYGHEMGDAALAAIAGRLKSGIRECDMACRFGGEELVLILIDCNRDDAFQRAEKLRESIEILNVQLGGQQLGQITASFGVAGFPLDGNNVETLFQAADRALYSAKRGGRNRTVMAS